MEPYVSVALECEEHTRAMVACVAVGSAISVADRVVVVAASLIIGVDFFHPRCPGPKILCGGTVNSTFTLTVSRVAFGGRRRANQRRAFR